MKYSFVCSATASVLAILLPLVTAAPPSHVINARQGVPCDLGSVDALSFVTDTDSQRKRRWDLFSASGENIEENQLTYHTLPQPSDPSLFTLNAIPSSSDTFTIVRISDNFELALNDASNGFIGVSPNGIPLQVLCSQCPGDTRFGSLFADGCIVQAAPNGQPNGLCASITSEGENEAISLVSLLPCDFSQLNSGTGNTQLHAIFAQNPDAGDIDPGLP